MRILILIVFVICIKDAYSQQSNDSLKNSSWNQFDFGVNFSYFFDRYGLAIDNDIASFPNGNRSSAWKNIISTLGSFHFGYKRELGKNFCAIINYQNFDFAQRTFNKKHI